MTSSPQGSVSASRVSDPVEIEAVVDRACRRIAPLWPLSHFVAANPFLGLTDATFGEAARVMAERGGARMTAPRAFYAAAIDRGQIKEADLLAALAAHGPEADLQWDLARLKAFARAEEEPPAAQLLPTVAHVASTTTDGDWAQFITESISRWAASYFDQGQSYWQSPWRHLAPYAAWRAEAAVDRTPEVMGVPGFRSRVGALPASAPQLFAYALSRLDVPRAGLEAYLHRLLLTVGGWAGHARHRLWEAELRGETDRALSELLAIRLAWEIILLDVFGQPGLAEAWARGRAQLASTALEGASQKALSGELLLQRALEFGYQRRLSACLTAGQEPASQGRKRLQAAFCIDVRSELLRRSLEGVDREVETIGFAGFFGIPMEYVHLGDSQGGAHCPALLAPRFVIRESVRDADAAEEERIGERRSLRRQAAKAWRSFKFGAVSCFGFVGPVGLAYLKKLVTDSLGESRPVDRPDSFGLDEQILSRLQPDLASGEVAGRVTGMTPAERADVAAGALTAMSLTQDFARLVLLVGHGSTTVNNPYASGLDCGACGGHTGEASARVAAELLNDPQVRADLGERGIHIPADTHFLAALHDTTTDEITLFGPEGVPAGLQEDVAHAQRCLAEAGRLARAGRAAHLGIAVDGDVDAAVFARSRDWSQVRPEWGLAGCAAFIAAPRARTYGRDLEGRVFLHDYEWRQDDGFGVLELIMTAPMVVASWINLQYYGSTVDNRAFGSGNKVLHNVVGALGVLEGNGGDLRQGLPWQSLHDGRNLVHEPLRLSVYLEAPVEAMNEILARHPSVRELVDNGWIHLFALDETGRVAHGYAGNLTWTAVEIAPAGWESEAGNPGSGKLTPS